MLFDSSALVIGLVASYMAEWPASHTFPMGYKRVEVISGFVNGIFLVFVGASVAFEAVERMREPPDVCDDGDDDNDDNDDTDNGCRWVKIS